MRYDYDAAGRMTHRWQYGKLPEGATEDAQRPFVEKRVFVWEGDALAAEAAYGNAEETIFRWRKTYVPGPSGLDDAVQVVVEDAAGTARTYTLLRDEMGTVVGLVAEDEGNDPQHPPVPARYHYTPYGEAHAETGPELDRARFDGEAKVVEAGGTVVQAVSDERTAASGAMVLDWSLDLDPATLPGNLVVEREDPMADTDSPNLYAFVGWQPNMATDPLGLCGLWDIATNEDKCGEYFVEGLEENFLTKEMLSTAISFIPGVGDVKDAQEAITGVDLITGRELSWMERGITVAAAVIPMVGGSALRHALGNAGEKAAREGVEALEEGAEQAMKRGADVAEEGAEHAAREGAERASREGAEALDDVSAPHQAKSLDEATAPPCPVAVNCFAAGTLVSTSEGLLPIEQVQPGDQVYAYDDATGEEHLAEVVALHHRDVEATWVLEVGGEKIETTDEHPFYVAGQGWTEAKDLQAGDLLVAEGGDRLSLDKVERDEGNARVYNFEVRDLHSYFVGTVGAVVHNCRPLSAHSIRSPIARNFPVVCIRTFPMRSTSKRRIDSFTRYSRRILNSPRTWTTSIQGLWTM